MYRLFKIVILASIIILAQSFPAQARNRPDSTDISAKSLKKIRAIDNILNDFININNIPGLAVGIIENNRLIMARGYGLRDIKAKLPVDSLTIFPISSCSKPFLSLAIGIAVDSSLIYWDKPIKEYNAKIKFDRKQTTKKITISELLSHQSGLPRHEYIWYRSPNSRESIIKNLKYLETAAPVGSKFIYSNLNYALAGEVLQKISKMNWDDYIQKYILDPLHMNLTSFTKKAMTATGNFAYPYIFDRYANKSKQVDFLNLQSIAPAISINSNVLDLSKFLTIFLDNNRKKNRLVSEKSLEKLLSVSNLTGIEAGDTIGTTYALGWYQKFYRGSWVYEHPGGIDGYTAYIAFLPDEKAGIILLANQSGNWDFARTSHRIIDILLNLTPNRQTDIPDTQVRDKLAELIVTKPDDANPMSYEIDEYIGEYYHRAYGLIAIDKYGNGLKGRFNNLLISLKHINQDMFKANINKTDELLIEFRGKGKIDRLAIPLDPELAPMIFKKKK